MSFSYSPAQLPSSSWQSLPTVPGIYIYKDLAGKIIYVGKAKNLKSRVSSYFKPVDTLGAKTAALVSQIASIEIIEVNSEVEALLLESRLIKKHKPQYNLISKDDKSPYYIHLTKESFPRPLINHESKGAVAGPFLSGLEARRILKQFRRVAPFCTAKRPVKNPCFYSHLGLCTPCPGSNASVADYRKNIIRLKSLLMGNFSAVSRLLKSEIKASADSENFELAAVLRDNLKSLDLLLSQPVLPDEYLVNPNLVADKRQEALDSLRIELIRISNFEFRALNRIEMYDIANLQGTSATAAMTVAIDGEVNSKYYRHFTIKTKSTPDDVGMMAEVLDRRLAHTDWPTPDLIVLDGGKSQLSIISKFEIRNSNFIPIISLAKREETIIIPQYNDSGDFLDFSELKLPLNHPGLRLLQRLRDEAHRFSRRLHHKHRAKLITRR